MSRTQPIYVAVYFGNGQARQVLDSTTDFLATWTVFAIDLDSDGIPDAGVIEKSSSGVMTVRYFHSDGTGRFTPTSGPCHISGRRRRAVLDSEEGRGQGSGHSQCDR